MHMYSVYKRLSFRTLCIIMVSMLLFVDVYNLMLRMCCCSVYSFAHRLCTHTGQLLVAHARRGFNALGSTDACASLRNVNACASCSARWITQKVGGTIDVPKRGVTEETAFGRRFWKSAVVPKSAVSIRENVGIQMCGRVKRMSVGCLCEFSQIDS